MAWVKQARFNYIKIILLEVISICPVAGRILFDNRLFRQRTKSSFSVPFSFKKKEQTLFRGWPGP